MVDKKKHTQTLKNYLVTNLVKTFELFKYQLCYPKIVIQVNPIQSYEDNLPIEL